MIRHKDYLLVTVPEGAVDPWIINNGGEKPGLAYYMPNKTFGEEGNMFSASIQLDYKAKYQLIGLASELTGEQWREIVEWYGVGDGSVDEAGVGDIFWCYDESDFCFDTAIKSGKSLLKYHNLNASTTVILKLIQP